MKESQLFSRMAKMDEQIRYLQSSINQKEATIFAMWSVINTLLTVLEEKGVYTKEEFTKIGLELAEKRNAHIAEVLARAKKEGKPIQHGDVKDDTLMEHINLVHKED